jgi:DUF1680 family protein
MRAGGREDILGGTVAIEVEGVTVDTAAWDSQLYRTVSNGFDRELPHRRLTLTAIPYYAWANRGPGTMRVWIPALD